MCAVALSALGYHRDKSRRLQRGKQIIRLSDSRGERLALFEAVVAAGIGRVELYLAAHVVHQRAVRDEVQRQQDVEAAAVQRDLAVRTHEDIIVGDRAPSGQRPSRSAL